MTRFSEEWYARRLGGGVTTPDIPTLTDVVRPAPRASTAPQDRRHVLILPWPPSGNTATRHTKAGGHYLTDDHHRFRSCVASIWQQSKFKPVQSPFAVEVVWYPPDRRRRDSDNVQKTLFDALIKCGAIADDSMADRRAYKESVIFEKQASGRVWLCFMPFPVVGTR